MQQAYYTDKGKVEVRWKPPAQPKAHDGAPAQHSLRVAVYARVSTELDVQADSIELQERHYTQLIERTPGWRFAGIYSDKGITGTQRRQRQGFQRMMRHCEEGKIDKIICKSISRFGRNTLDLLDAVRMLKEQNIGVMFEKEGIDTLSVQSEFVLSMLAAIAQEESRSISENLVWACQKGFQRGVPRFQRILGYNVERKGGESHITINEPEALIVRDIFDLALQGTNCERIARTLIEYQCRTVKGKAEWTGKTVRGILTNERYTGDVLCQKTYTPDFLKHTSEPNSGERPQYLIKDHHPAIISQETFQTVQRLLKRIKRSEKRTKKVYPLTGRVICGHCGVAYHRYGLTQDVKWKCSRSMKSSKLCSTKPIDEGQLERVMLNALELRYDFTDKDIVQKLKLEMKRFLEEDAVEGLRVNLKKELAAALEKELQATVEEQERVMASRKELEEKLEQQERYWNLLEQDWKYRVSLLQWLEGLPHGGNGVKIFLGQLNSERIRAWVMGITISSPISFTVQWFDQTETTVEVCDETVQQARVKIERV